VHGNDEAMKMAITDALGTAMKMLGMAGDVYRGFVNGGTSDSKYSRRDDVASQNAPQSTQSTSKGKSTKNTQKNDSEPSDKVRYQAIENLNVQIRRLGLSKEDIVTVANHVVGKSGRDEMTVEEILKLAEYLAGEEPKMAITSRPQRKG
jgi:hypothetical protein